MKLKERHREWICGYSYTLPALLFMLVLIGYPIVYNIAISFQNMTAKNVNLGEVDFIGLENYRLLFDDPIFLLSLKNTVIYTVICIAIQFTLGFALALLFNKQFAVSKALRGFLLISWMLTTNVTALIFKFMFSMDGVINQFLIGLHILEEPLGWLVQENTAMLVAIIANCWVGIPFNMLLINTGLTAIPREIYESAAIDGAGSFSRFFSITLPMLKQSILSVLVLGFVYTFKVFDLIFVMTGGGPVNATEVLSTYSYRQSFKFYDFGGGAAAANVLFICLFIIGLLYLKLLGREEE